MAIFNSYVKLPEGIISGHSDPSNPFPQKKSYVSWFSSHSQPQSITGQPYLGTIFVPVGSTPGDALVAQGTCCRGRYEERSNNDTEMWRNMMTDDERQWKAVKHYEKLWYIMKHYETLWNIMIHYETLWYIMKHYETLWYIMKHYETWWTIMK